MNHQPAPNEVHNASDRRGRLSRDRYRNDGAWLTYLAVGAALWLAVPVMAYRYVLDWAGTMTAGLVVGLMVGWLVFGVVTDAILTRVLAPRARTG